MNIILTYTVIIKVDIIIAILIEWLLLPWYIYVTIGDMPSFLVWSCSLKVPTVLSPDKAYNGGIDISAL